VGITALQCKPDPAYSGALHRQMRKPVCIEKLLQWAYREELPKSAVGGLTGWEKLVLLGTRVDEPRNDDPGFPVALGAPHPDALLIDYHVRALDDVTMLWEQSVDAIMGELAPYAPADDPILTRMQFSPSALIQLHARMGNRPIWDLGPLRLTRVVGRNGKPVTNGITAGGRYAEGSACPLQLDPPGREIACARAEYFIWRSALSALASESWNLVDHAPQQPSAAALPWREDTERKVRVLRDIRPRVAIA